MDIAKTIIKMLNNHLSEFKQKFGVKRISLFGSHARGEAHKNSDIDILVMFETPTFDNYMDLKFRLESLLKSPVDLVLEDTLKPRLKQQILNEAVHAEG